MALLFDKHGLPGNAIEDVLKFLRTVSGSPNSCQLSFKDIFELELALSQQAQACATKRAGPQEVLGKLSRVMGLVVQFLGDEIDNLRDERAEWEKVSLDERLQFASEFREIIKTISLVHRSITPVAQDALSRHVAISSYSWSKFADQRPLRSHFLNLSVRCVRDEVVPSKQLVKCKL